ncbi:hypothetical protein D3C85_1891970 [compost metagenome]
MKEHVLANCPYSNFANFLVALTLIERQVMLVTRVQHDALGVFIFSTPVMHRL